VKVYHLKFYIFLWDIGDFDTTRRYYIHITDARKQQEALKLYNKQYSEEELQALFERNKMYLEKISVLV